MTIPAEKLASALTVVEQFSHALAILLIVVVTALFWNIKDCLRKRPWKAFAGGLFVIIAGTILVRNSPDNWEAASNPFHSAMIGLGVSLVPFSLTARPEIDIEKIDSLEEDGQLTDSAISRLEEEAGRLDPSKDRWDAANSHLRHGVQDRLFDLRLWRRKIDREILKLQKSE